MDRVGSGHQRLDALRAMHDVAVTREELVGGRFRAGLTSDLDVQWAKSFRLQVDVQAAEELAR